ncbi:MAG: hypothetical protein ACHQVK_00735 [Candidatus Paceibacterales bacterium]
MGGKVVRPDRINALFFLMLLRLVCNSSLVFVKVLEGSLKETLFEWPDENTESEEPVKEKSANTYEMDAGVAYINDTMGLHRMENPSHTDGTVTLHLYVPPFDSCATFDQRTGKKRMCRVTFWSKYGERTALKVTYLSLLVIRVVLRRRAPVGNKDGHVKVS